jgi:arsenate reductase
MLLELDNLDIAAWELNAAWDSVEMNPQEWDLPESAVLQDIKKAPMTAGQIDEMAKLAGSYRAIFSTSAVKYRTLGLNDRNLTEKDYRKFLLEEYTFLKRPVVIVGNEIFIGSSKDSIAAATAAIESQNH